MGVVVIGRRHVPSWVPPAHIIDEITRKRPGNQQDERPVLRLPLEDQLPRRRSKRDDGTNQEDGESSGKVIIIQL